MTTAIRTVRLAEGKYEFDLDEKRQLVAARRHGVAWPAGLDLRHTNAFCAALAYIVELEDEIRFTE